MTLLLGHKQQVLREAIRVTKRGDVIFAAYVIFNGGLLDEGFKRGNISVSKYIEQGLIDPDTFAAKSNAKDTNHYPHRFNIEKS